MENLIFKREALVIPHGKANISDWQLSDIRLVHGKTVYNKPGEFSWLENRDIVNLHFTLAGEYRFRAQPLGVEMNMKEGHHNILYSPGSEMVVENRESHIETFGIQFQRQRFLELTENGNEVLKRFADKVMRGEGSLLTSGWGMMSPALKQAIQSVLNCHYTGGMQELFLLSKSLEILVLQAEALELMEVGKTQEGIPIQDRNKLWDAKKMVEERLSDPPTLPEVSSAVGLNQYKLKKGFKALFGTTLYGYITDLRLAQAKVLLLDKEKTVSEIAYELGYSSPQHFSKAFKKKFGITPGRFN